MDNSDKLTLYCVAIERFIKGNWKPDLVYTHAKDRVAAMHSVCSSEKRGINYRIVNCAPVVGYKAHDSNGLILSV